MTTTRTRAVRYATPVDTKTFGEYVNPQRPDDPRPLYRFTGRLSADGSTGFPAEAGRYHLYAGWFCPWAQRVTLEIAFNGLSDVIGVSYVDDSRDGRGWAFRETHGADPVNGFTLLRQAYEATRPGFDGHISVPTLWDARTAQVVSNDYRTLGIDIATQFAGVRRSGIDTYPEERRAEIESLDAWIGPAVNQGVSRVRGEGPGARQARTELLDAFARLDALLTDGGFLVGRGLTEADIRLWVSLARYDVQTNATGQVGPPLTEFPHLARYAAWLAEMPAFRSTTRWESFAVEGAQPSFLDARAVGSTR